MQSRDLRSRGQERQPSRGSNSLCPIPKVLDGAPKVLDGAPKRENRITQILAKQCQLQSINIFVFLNFYLKSYPSVSYRTRTGIWLIHALHTHDISAVLWLVHSRVFHLPVYIYLPGFRQARRMLGRLWLKGHRTPSHAGSGFHEAFWEEEPIIRRIWHGGSHKSKQGQ